MKPSVARDRRQEAQGPTTPSLRPVTVFAWYALALGLFLGLAILKFGNPVILDRQVGSPADLTEAWNFAWPTRWAYWGIAPLLLIGLPLAISGKPLWPQSRWLWMMPFVWLGWQFVAATRTVDAELTRAVLGQFCGCVFCYLLGVLVIGKRRVLPWLLAGVLAAFAWCLVRAANQRLIEFPRDRAALIEGGQVGWTNFSAPTVAQLRESNFIITTNGVEVVNPIMLAKLTKGRVYGTVVYPNALASLILLLLPVSLVLVFARTGNLRFWIRAGVIGLALFLGLGGLFWTGSKLGWLVGLGLVGVWLWRLNWSRRLKFALVVCVAIGGLGLFAWRFQSYFADGAKSVGARFDYWGAAVVILAQHPVTGTGPGTFQRPYAAIKSPESEMARLTHNDYLEQFCDSGLVGGLSYLGWIALALVIAGRGALVSSDLVRRGVFLGLLGWFLQGFGEFSLYVPALAWTAFALLGTVNAMDSPKSPQ